MSACAGSEPFALRVLGSSMEPEFSEGEIIIVEPGVAVEDGAFVVAMHDEEYIFRQLAVRGDRLLLKALNADYPELPVRSRQDIKGRVISKSSGRGRQSKSYL